VSVQDQKTFLKSAHPFEMLSDADLDFAIANMDIAYYAKDTVLIDKGNVPSKFFIILKGEIEEKLDDELIKVYHSLDSFDANSLIYNKSEHSFIVSEELICYEMAKEHFLALLENSKPFKDYYLSDLAQKIQSIKQKEYSTQMSGFMIARIYDTYLHDVLIVDEECPIFDALKQMDQKRDSCIIVKYQNGAFGIVTDSVIRKKVILKDKSFSDPIGPIANSPIITMSHDDYLFNALLTFTKHSIKRVAIIKDAAIIGVLEQLDLLSYFANHSYLVSVQIKKAKTLDELKRASLDLINIIKKINAKGVKVEYISKLVAELNQKIYEKLFKMTLPRELRDDCALIVMGSEGRKEQILKTDQDNALIIKDGVDVSIYTPYMQKLNQTLIDFGFPKCDGDIMVSNPYWCKNQNEYKKEIERWMESAHGDDFMHMAIFFDSICVAGNESLLSELKKIIFDKVEHKDVFMANFAKASLIFDTPIGMFSNLITDKNEHKNELNIKKGGIFPIVQGVRAYSLRYKVEETDTISRIQALAKKTIFEERFAGELIEAFDTLRNLRLKNGLDKLERGLPADNYIKPADLSKLEIDLLKDSLKIVNSFKKSINHHFKVDFVS
jgi:CBS domain-containing protein